MPEARGLVLVLGGGGARGLAHVGALQVLVEHGIPVRAVVGTSIGAEMGAFFAAGMPVGEMVELARSLDWKTMLQLFLPDLPSGGLVSGRRIEGWLSRRLGDALVEALPIPFAAVATDLESGEQVVIDRGPAVEAVRASISMPGTLSPVRLGGRVLVDGGVVNQVPCDVARERFGAPVLAVAVHSASQRWDLQRRKPARPEWLERIRRLLAEPWMHEAPRLRDALEAEAASPDDPIAWSTRRVLERVMHVAQAELVRLRLATSPPEILLVPDVHDIGTLEFHRAEEAIEAGRAAALARIHEIRDLARGPIS
jgi:NTE family protein